MQFVQYAPERGGPGSLPIKVALRSRAGADYRHGSIQPGVASLNGADAHFPRFKSPEAAPRRAAGW